LPITKSAKKSLKVSLKKRANNRVQEIELEKAVKKVSASNINEVISKIDKAAKTNLISKNKAARMKSRLAKKYGTPKATKPPKIQSPKSKPQNDNAKSKIKTGAKK